MKNIGTETVGSPSLRTKASAPVQASDARPARKRKPVTSKPLCLLILGMHRSGTSMLTRLLNIAGYALPADLIGATKDNPTGHWEPTVLNKLNQEFLERIGSDWSDWSHLDLEALPGDVLAAYRSDLRAWLRAEKGNRYSLVLKEPRACRLAFPILDALADEDFETRVIIPYRNPLDVARSLEVRDQIPLRRGVLIWMRHVLDAEVFSRGLRRSFVDYAQLMQDWAIEAERLSRDLGLDRLARIDEIAEEADSFISDEHRHHSGDIGTLEVIDYTAGMALTIYRALADLCADPNNAEVMATFDQLRLQLDEIEHLTLPTQRDTDRLLMEVQTALRALEVEHVDLKSRYDEMSRNVGGIWELHDTIADLNKKNESYISDLTARLADREEAVHLRSEELTRAQIALNEKIHEINELNARLTELTHAGQMLQQRLDETAKRLDESYAERALFDQAMQGRITQLDGQLSEAWERLQTSNEARNRAEGERLQLEQDLRLRLVDLETKLNASRAEIERHRAEHDDMFARLSAAEMQLSESRAQLERQAAELAETSGALEAERDARRDIEIRLTETTAQLGDVSGQLIESRQALTDTTTQLNESRQAFTTVTSQLADRNLRLDQTVADRAEIVQQLQARAGELAHVQALLQDRDRQLGTERDQAQAQMQALLQDHDRQLSAERDQAQAQMQALYLHIAHLDRVIAAHETTISALRSSTSWRITAPMRVVMTGTRWVKRGSRRSASVTARFVWHHFPLPWSRKLQFKDKVLSKIGFLLGGTHFYHAWQEAKRDREVAAEQLQAIQRQQAQHLRPAQPQPPAEVAPEPPEAAMEPVAVEQVLIAETNTFVARRPTTDLTNPKARLIAFYLPQFHPIPENDAWWGKGFTEWTNVGPAQPQFPGHYQPHEPVPELGQYDLLDTDVQRKQIALAKLYGIGGFCFYWYWFGGKRLLEKPVRNWLDTPDLDFPFCICWANENWSRRWDGLDQELLISQNHSPEDDLAFIAELAPYLRDPRYIRIDGKPLILLYRPSLMPNVVETSARWRDWCRQNGIGEIYLAYPQSFETVDPAQYGFDAAVEFPPNNYSPDNLTSRVPGLASDFGGIVYDWRSYVTRSRNYPMPDYKLYRSVCPSWDNTARRKNKGAIFANSNPADYRVWLENAVTRTLADARTPDERVIFVNAWNEWAEGAHLEPDTKYGYAYLDASRAALNPAEVPRTVTLVGHDAHPHGAQILLLNLARSYAQNGLKVQIVLLQGGQLVTEYARHAQVIMLDDPAFAGENTTPLLRSLRAEDGQVAIVNTTVSADILPMLRDAGYRTISLIHEMKSVYDQMNLRRQMTLVADHADRIVFPAPLVQTQFETYLGRELPQAMVRPQGLYLHELASSAELAAERARLRAELGIDAETTVLLGVGYVDHRKGGDLFVRTLAALRGVGRKVQGIWIGHGDIHFQPQVEALARELGVAEHMRFLGRQQNPIPFYAASDVFLLSSREDPFPSVVLEAMAAGLPCVMFGGTTGCELLAQRGLAIAVTGTDPVGMAHAVESLIDHPERRGQMVAAARDYIEAEADFTKYTLDLLGLSGRHVPRVSVIVPNYNYGRYIEDRLNTVLAQDFPIYEIIVLDDRSSDDSLDRIRAFAARCDRPIRIVPNETNSGNVFRQWIKGLELAHGDYIWIAEADDLALPDFLTTAMRGFEKPGTVLSYTDSAQIDENGTPLAPNYRYYTDKISPTHWAQNYCRDGAEEISEVLYLKNTIPNVSGVVMAAKALQAVLAEHRSELESVRFVGDWLVYLWLLEHGGIAFNTASKNIHRRHQNSVTISNFDAKQLAEIEAVQRDVLARHGLGSAQKQRAEDYVTELAVQFGLKGKTKA